VIKNYEAAKMLNIAISMLKHRGLVTENIGIAAPPVPIKIEAINFHAARRMAERGITYEIESMVYCPIFDTKIDSAYCYEINLVAFGLCTPCLINNATDRVTAKNTCSGCVNKQI